jgi:hypothetical protein
MSANRRMFVLGVFMWIAGLLSGIGIGLFL